MKQLIVLEKNGNKFKVNLRYEHNNFTYEISEEMVLFLIKSNEYDILDLNNLIK